MYAYEENDFSTPESLLAETVSYAREIFADLKKAKILSGNKWNPKIQHIGVTCVAENEDDFYIAWRQSLTNNLVIRRKDGKYAASHPAIVDSVYPRLIIKVMEKAGFVHANSINTRKNFDQYQENDFDMGCARGSTFVESVSISCLTSPEKLRQALNIDDLAMTRAFDDLCLKALQECFEEQAQLRQQEKASYSEQIPKVIKVILKKPDGPQ